MLSGYDVKSLVHGSSVSLTIGALVAFLALVGVPSVHAQGFEVEGVVLSADAERGLAGVNVVEAGTQTGTTTNANGEFQLTVSGPNAKLQFSFVGFQTKTVPVNGRSELTVRLTPATRQLDEVVVTALGIERQRRGLGYSVESVEAQDIVQSTESNVAKLLQGKIAGVNVSSTGGGPGGSARITIRGASGLGSNRPLFVIDGVPIDNQNFGSASQWGGFDEGTALSDLDPSNIKSINVLKGAAAAALYGTRARNGVVEITTKQGREGQMRVNVSSKVTLDQPLSYFNEYQTKYGAGTQGRVPQTLAEAREFNFSSWGDRMSDVSKPVIQPDGKKRPYKKRIDRLGFYESHLNTQNTISVSGGTDNITSFLSASYLGEGHKLPKTKGMRRYSLNLNTNATVGRLTADVKANYINQKVKDRHRLHDFPGNPHWPVSFFPPTYELDDMKPGFDPETLAELRTWIPTIWVQNPWFVVNRFKNTSERNRLIGHLNLQYQLLDGLTLSGRTDLDLGFRDSKSVTPDGTGWKQSGSVNNTSRRTIESRTQVKLSATYSLPYNLSVNGFAAGSYRIRHDQVTGAGGSGFRIPGFAVLTNMRTQSAKLNILRKKQRSIYGSVNFNYNDYLYLQVTGRNDWTSTLPQDNNSIFYPSVSGGFVFSDVFSSAMPSWLEFGKIRAAWAEVGSGTRPYQLDLTYQFASTGINGRQLGNVATGNIPLASLRPTSTREIELGTQLRFLEERLTLDFTWYDRETTNQILSADVGPSTGYGSRTINAGRISNTGVELMLTGVPLQTDDMRWSFNVNFSRNINTVEALRPGLPEVRLGQSRVLTGFSVARVGEAMSSIKGSGFVRDENGNIVHGQNGLPLVSDNKILGKGTPDWSSGIGTTFSYRNLSLDAQLYVEWGGQVFSATNAWATENGLHTQTLAGRAQCEQAAGPDGRYPEEGCWVPDGSIYETGKPVFKDGSPVDEKVLPQTYWDFIGDNIAEHFVYDRNVIELSSLRLTYRLPNSLINEIENLQSANISIMGRNLGYLYDQVPNVDPLVERNAKNDQGLEGTTNPTSRTFGISVDLTF